MVAPHQSPSSRAAWSVRAIDRKALRNLWEMRGQAFAIAMVIASGIATFVMSLSTYDSLYETRQTFYREFRFAEGFASVVRAPRRVVRELEAIDGIDRFDARVVALVNLDIAGYDQPATARLISLPETGRPELNDFFIRRGERPDPRRESEIAVSESFADAHGFDLGDTLFATINGRRKQLEIVGIVLSPEYIYQIAPGSMIPDFAAYGVFWMGEPALARAYDMDGAFNDVTFTLARNAVAADVLDRLDRALEPYGGRGAYLRKDQLSHRFLSEEFRQLRQMAVMFPIIFLGVAAFLLSVVTNRIVQTQREQIAALKAFGYSNATVGLHYLKLILLIVAVGVIIGVWIGSLLGRAMSELYTTFYKFPELSYVLHPEVIAGAVVISVLAALVGNLRAVRAAAALPPAEAMRPAPPATYRVSIVERLGLGRHLSQPLRMVIRHLERTPLKTMLSVLGIAFGCAILVLGFFFNDAIDAMVEVQFGAIQREDIAVTLTEPTSRRAAHELRSLPGVERVEVSRSVAVRLRFEQREYRITIQGLEPGGDLLRLLDDQLRPVPLPEEGLVLTDHLAELLGCRPGDSVVVEVLEGRRPVVAVPVARVVKQYIGVSASMSLDALSRLLGEGDTITGAYLAVDGNQQSAVLDALESRPRVAGTVALQNQLQNFLDTVGNQMLTFAFFNTLLAMTIALGVVYNSARITLSEKARELASLRVLGLTRQEISTILLSELAIITLLAIPIGWGLGFGLSAFLAEGMQTDLFRIPLVIRPRTLAFAATVIVVASVLSGWIVRRKLDHLDLVEALKSPD